MSAFNLDQNACVHNLRWTHFRSLLKVADSDARLWYMNEASGMLEYADSTETSARSTISGFAISGKG